MGVGCHVNASGEPTPLSAHFQPLTLEEERRYYRWCDEQRDYIGRVTAWRKFDAQATEIAALKGALESIEAPTAPGPPGLAVHTQDGLLRDR